MKNFKQIISSFTLFILILACMPSFSASANTLKGVRVWPAPDETRVVIDLNNESHYSYFSLSNPQRLVVDILDISNKVKLPIDTAKSPILKKIRLSTPKDDTSLRLVFDLTKPAETEVFKLAPTPNGEYGHRLVIDIAHPNKNSNDKVSSTVSSANTTNSNSVARDASQYIGQDDVIVAIDAGHGGEDPGSIGPGGNYEKNATLAISKKLAAKLNAISGVKAVLTRTGDYFVRLNKRSDIARKNKAHLLVSIHADAFETPQPRGASVFVLNTRRANTEISKWVENHERQSELLGGAGQVLAKNNSDPNVSQTLLDLQFSHSQKEGYKLAKDILSEIGKVAYLHKKSPVNASLAVLKSPDIPSVLVETGFISNPKEEKLLFSRLHQDKLANSMTKAIVQYFDDNPPEGTLFAARKKATKHVVKSGESLSIVAKRYGTSVDRLLETNKLKSTTLRVGQVLLVGGTSSPSISTPNSQVIENKVIIHTVKPGEYLGQLATRYNVSVTSIKQQNKLKSSVLKVGQKLKITTKVSRIVTQKKPVNIAPVKTTKVVTHSVKPGEYLGQLATRYDVSVASIKQQNKLKSSVLKVGQKLKITTNKGVVTPSKPAPLRKYKVRRGDFLSKIASRFNVSVNSLRATNKLRTDRLLVDQVLLIPEK
ncbi:LysM peptidoglycan-binding domain-containing protein [Vibrio sp. WJH972]